ncbi:MAG: hypothetical protein QOI61_175 [Actinomycetota bacterium]
MEQQSVTLNDVELAYWIRSANDDGSTPLVLVHGFMGNSRSWNPVVDQLAADRPVITFDHRGHGASTNTGVSDTYCFDQLVSDFAALVDHLQLERFHVLGHSMGGVVAMRYAVDHPERIASLVPMDTAAAAAPDDVNDNVGFMRTGIEIAGTQGMLALFETINAAIPDLPELEEFREGLRYDLLAMDPLAFVRFGNELLEYPSFLDRLAQLTMPATVLVGENDLGLRDAAQAMATTIPGATLSVIPNAAHSPQIENPAGWLEAVAGHFERQAS